MSTHSIAADTARARHPETYDELVKKIKASKSKLPLEPDENKWSWSYQLAEAIESESMNIMDMFSQMSAPRPEPVLEAHVSGRKLLEQKKEVYAIGLAVNTGRRSAYESLDNQALLDGPESSLPIEVLGVFPRPAGPSAWVWNEPGPGLAAYREQIIVGAVQSQKGIIIQAKGPDQEEHLYLMDPITKKGQEVIDWDDVLSSKEVRELDKTLKSGQPHGTMGHLNEAALFSLFTSSEGIMVLDARAPSISDLIGALRGPGFMAFGEPPADEEAPPPGEGPWVSFDGEISSTYTAPSSQARSTPRP